MQDLNCQFCDLFIGQCEQLAPIGPITCAICENTFRMARWFLTGYDTRFHPSWPTEPNDPNPDFSTYKSLSWQYYDADRKAQEEIEKLRLFMIDFLRGDYE